jgi:hypothetical protein
MTRNGRTKSLEANARRRFTRVAAGALALAQLVVPARALGQDRILGRGGWCWFADPRAVHHAGRTYAGWLDWGGHVNVGAYDEHSGRRVTVALFGHVDDHASPTLSVRPDQRLMVFFSQHDGRHILYRVATRPLDIASWGPTLRLPTRRLGPGGNTYPSPLRLPAQGDRLWVFWRGTDWSSFFSIERGSRRWSPPRRMIRVPGERPYVKYASDGRGTIHMAFTRSHPREAPTGIYYAKYRHGAVYRASGRRIRTVARLPFSPREADKVYDARRHGASGWVHDIAVGPDGRPVIVYAVIHSRSRHSYRYARWTGRRWADHFIVGAGGTISTTPREWGYSGGISLDKRDPSIVYLSRKIRGVNEIERWRTRDRGRSWSHQALTRGLRWGAYRPVVPLGMSAADGQQVLWTQGYYGTYRTFRTWVHLHSPGPTPPALVGFRATAPASAPANEVALEASVLQPGPSPPVSLVWRLGDGQTAFGSSVRHRYPRPGDYFPRLEVRDANGVESVYVREIRAGN